MPTVHAVKTTYVKGLDIFESGADCLGDMLEIVYSVPHTGKMLQLIQQHLLWAGTVLRKLVCGS